MTLRDLMNRGDGEKVFAADAGDVSVLPRKMMQPLGVFKSDGQMLLVMVVLGWKTKNPPSDLLDCNVEATSVLPFEAALELSTNIQKCLGVGWNMDSGLEPLEGVKL